jgi:uncharacterized membrane protein YbhN (UPF0104 family)
MSGPRAALLALAKLAFSVTLLVVLFRRISLERIAAVFGEAEPAWLVAAATMMLASNLLGSYMWGRLLRAVDIHIPFWKVSAYYHIGLFFNNFLPANIGGDIARVADSSRYGPTPAAAVSAVLMDRLIGTVALAGLALLTTLPAADRFDLALVYLALVAFFVLSVALLWGVFHPALMPACARLLQNVGLGRLAPHLADLAVRLAGYRERRELLVRMIGLATLTQLLRIGVHALVARALHVDVALQYFFLFVPLLAVIVSLPISLNGLGVREGAGVVLFGLIGVDRAHAFSLQFLTYLVAVAVSLLGGLAYLLRIPRRRAEARSFGRNAWR